MSDPENISLTESNNRTKIYRATGNPGRYYFLHTRKIVPGQILRGGASNPNFPIEKYEVVPKPDRRQAVRNNVVIDYSKIKESDPVVSKHLYVTDINMIATKHGWKLSARANKALQAWGKSVNELSDILASYKEQYSDCNYLDYSVQENKFITKWKNPAEPPTPVPSAEE